MMGTMSKIRHNMKRLKATQNKKDLPHFEAMFSILTLSNLYDLVVDRYLATTQFESTDARKAFPCFDEPEFKAAFNVKLVRKSHLKSLSNMPIIRNETL